MTVRGLAMLGVLAIGPACGRLQFDPIAPSADGSEAQSDGARGEPGGDAAATAGFVGAGPPVASSTGVDATLDIPVPSNVQAGDLLLLQIAHWQVTVDPPSGWATAVPDFYDGYCDDSGMVIYYRKAGIAEPESYSTTCHDYCSAVIVDIRGTSPAPLDAIGALGKTTETTTTCSANLSPQLQAVPSVTATAGDWIVLFYSDNNDAQVGGTISQSLPSGFTPIYSFLSSDGAGQDALAGIMGPATAGPDGAQTVTALQETMCGWTGVQLAIAPAP